MRNLSTMDFHRRLRGVGKSKLGDATGTFDIPLKANVNAPPRKAVCVVSRNKGWARLMVSIKYWQTNRWLERSAYPAELARIIPMFFNEHEIPFQLFKQPLRYDDPAILYHYEEDGNPTEIPTF